MSFPSDVRGIMNQKFPVIKLSQDVCREFSLTGKFPKMASAKKQKEGGNSTMPIKKIAQAMGMIHDRDIKGKVQVRIQF